MSTLNHLKKGESLENKQLVIVNSDYRDDKTQNTSSFTYTFNDPIKRVTKIDAIHCKIPKTFYNINNDNATMSITTQTLDAEAITESLVVDDDEIKNNTIKTTNKLDGTLLKTNLSQGTGSIQNLTVKTKNTFVYTAGTFSNDVVDFKDFTGSSANKQLSNDGLVDLFVAQYSLEQELNWRVKISGVVDDKSINIDVSDTDIYVTGIFRSAPLTLFNADDTISKTLISDGLPSTFVAKYNNLGVHQWSFKILGIANETVPTHIVYDVNDKLLPGTNDSIYIAGTYNRNLEIFNTFNSNAPTDIITVPFGGQIWTPFTFLAKFTTNGSLLWISKMESNCNINSMVINPNNYGVANSYNIILGMSFTEPLKFYDGATPIASLPNNLNTFSTNAANDLTLDGAINLAIVEYKNDGTFNNKLKIGGSFAENFISLDIKGTTLAVIGQYASNPVRFYNNDGTLTPGNILYQSGTSINTFIAKYDITNTTSKTILWKTNTYTSTSNNFVNTDISINSELEFLICGNYTSLLKFNDVNGYKVEQDLINNNGTSFSYIAKYDTNGNFKQRSYIESVASGSSNLVSIDAHSNNIFVSGEFINDIKIYNSDSTGSLNIPAKTLVNATTSNTVKTSDGLILSLINNINSYTFDTTTLSKRIIQKTLTGTDLNYIINLNAFTQQLGFTTSRKFQAMIFSSPITWANLDVTNINNQFSINFSIGNIATKVFDTTTKIFTITNIKSPGYTPYMLAYELSRIIKADLTGDINVPFNQENDAVVYDDVKKIFYFQFTINGTFQIPPQTSTLINNTGLHILPTIPPTISKHCIITNQDASNNNISLVNNSKISLKANETVTNTLYNNVDFATAFPNVAGNSGSLTFTALEDSQLVANACNTNDNLNYDVKVNDEISFDTPWIQPDKNETSFINSLKWTSISISGDGIKQTAVANGENIFISTDSGLTWIPKGPKKKWVSVSVSENATFQSAISKDGNIYTSKDSGGTWFAKDSIRNWIDIAISRKASTGITEGQFQTALVRNGNIYISNDSGASWIAKLISKDWRSVAVSNNGSIQTAVAYRDNIYRSTDSGVTWVSVPNTTFDWQSVSMIADGTIQVAATDIGIIYKSIDSGVSWSQIIVAKGKRFSSIDISPENANIIIVTGDSGDLYVTSNGGTTWSNKGFNSTWASVSSSNDGTKHAAIINGGFIFQSTGSGNFWIHLPSLYIYRSIAMSSDGSIQLLSNNNSIYKSINFGKTWTNLYIFAGISGLNMSNNGQYIISTNISNINISNDSGVTWTTTPTLGFTLNPGISSTGKYITTPVVNQQLLVSSDFGVTWVGKGSAQNWSNVAISSNGLLQIAVIDTIGTNVYITHNAWTTSYALSPQGSASGTIVTGKYNTCAISDEGQYMIIAGSTCLLVSNSFGSKWISPFGTVSKKWTSVSMSSNGSIMNACNSENELYISKNFGVEWTRSNLTHKFIGTNISSSGIFQSALSTDAGLFTSNNTGTNWSVNRFAYDDKKNLTDKKGIAVSDDGKYITYVCAFTNIYVSNNYGRTFLLKGNIRDYKDIAMSSDGKIQAALSNLGVDLSINSGKTWVHSYNNSSLWAKLAMSKNGQKISIVGDGTRVITTKNTGVVWAPDNDSAVKTWSDISMNDKGDIMYATTIGNGIWKWDSTTPATWNHIINTGTYYGIACYDSVINNNDGKIVTATKGSLGSLIVSTDGLSSITSKPINATKVKMANAGKIQIARGLINTLVSTDQWNTYVEINIANSTSLNISRTINSILIATSSLYQSFDQGKSFGILQDINPVSVDITPLITVCASTSNLYITSGVIGSTFETIPISNTWKKIIIAYNNNQYIVAIPIYGKLYFSNDGGVTWTKHDNDRYWSCVSTNLSGTKYTATTYGGNIYTYTFPNISTNWTPVASVQNWTSIDMDSTGKYQTAVAYGGRIWTSTDFGSTWTPRYSVNNWQSVSVQNNNNGRLQTAVVYGGKIYISKNSGVDWEARESNRAWTDISMNFNGDLQVATVNGGKIYVSQDYGETWIERDSNRNWVALPRNVEQFIVAVDNKSDMYASYDVGLTWQNLSKVSQIESVDFSSDGTIMIVAVKQDSLYFSTDSGTNWIQTDEIRDWKSVAISSDGTKLTAVTSNSKVYTATYTKPTLSAWSKSGSFTGLNHSSVKMSRKGDFQIIVSTFLGVFVSQDSGANWSNKNSGVGSWISYTDAAISDDGKILTTTRINQKIRYSNDSGQTWQDSNSPVLSWISIEMSRDGKKHTALAVNGNIYISTNMIDWTAVGSVQNWKSVSMSDNGITQIAVAQNGNIFTSVDSGSNWIETNNTKNWRIVKMNSDGTKQIAVDNNNVYYHNFNVNSRIILNTESIITTPFNKLVARDITSNGTLSNSVNSITSILHNFDLKNAINITINRKEISPVVDVFIPPANYTPATLVTAINKAIITVNPAFTNAFSYDVSTNKISLTHKFSGSGLIKSTNLLKRMGFSELPTTLTASEPIIASSTVNADLSGPMGLFLKSTIIGELRKNPTAFSTNFNMKNLIAPLDLDETSNIYKIQNAVEMFLSRKSTITSLDLQISDETGNIVNFHGAPIQVNFNFYSS